MAFSLDRYLKERSQLVERELSAMVISSPGPASKLFEAMRYSLLDGGKRLRPILALGACEAVGGRVEDALGFACALEMIHTYSLVHDDLPCMDDDDLRRGRPTNHKVYGEAMATLAGDALLTDAFGVVARSPVARRIPAVVVETIAELAHAAGSGGMVAGQVIDLAKEGLRLNIEQLEYLHALKTGALFHISVRGGGRLGGASPEQLEHLSAYARAVGLCFQVVDDLLDVEGTAEQMGKRTQKDLQAGKNTYPGLLGVERSRALAIDLKNRAIGALAGFGDGAEPLRAIAAFVVERKL